MFNNKIFKDNKILLFLFLVAFVCFVAVSIISNRGLYFDIPAVFFGTISKLINTGHVNWIIYIDERARTFSNFVLTIPLNIVYSIIPIKKMSVIFNLFIFSQLIMPFVALLLTFFIAKRTKRYDVAVFALMFYSFFIIPGETWFIREMFVATMLHFALLTYFLSREKFYKLDIVIVGLLLIYTFESFETAIPLGIVLLIMSLFYVKKEEEDTNFVAKFLIAFPVFFAAIYIPVRLFLIAFLNPTHLELSTSLGQWVNAIHITFTHLFTSSMIITMMGIAFVIYSFFDKNLDIAKKPKAVIAFSLITLALVKKITDFIPIPDNELHFYSLGLVLFIPIVFAIIILDYKKIDLNKIAPNFYSNLISISCVVGILGFCWQINSSIYAKQYVDYLQNLLNTSKETLVKIPQKDREKYRFLNYDSCYGITHRSLLLKNDYQVKKILYPDNKAFNYNPFCFDQPDKTYYSEKDNYIDLQAGIFPIKSNYWDLGIIANELKKQGKVKK